MAEHASAEQPTGAGSKVSRRRFLFIGALGVGAAALFGPLRGLFGGAAAAPVASNDLPREGSMFHPRRDANLEAYERRTRGL